jgi:hypothetical protein
VVVGDVLVGLGNPQNGRFVKRPADDLYADRQVAGTIRTRPRPPAQ